MANKYKKLTQREHILRRSETYVGSKNTEPIEMYVIKDNDLSNIQVEKRKVNHNPAFIKLFDEILTNASDHSIRTDGKVKMIKVVIDDTKISIENDGDTIPIEMHPEEKVYNAELIFSHLLTGENYDDDEERVVGGRNGLGAKLVNVFSKKFKVECSDGKKLYKQWTKNNMEIIESPEIVKASSDKKFTRITYYPDYSQFDFDKLTDDLRSIMYKRCLDVAAYIPKVRVSVDGKTIPIKKISDFMKMHLPEDSEFFYETLSNGWELGISKSTEHGFEQVSIVNGISTHKGGTHINHISLGVSKQISDKIKKKVSWNDVKNKLFIFLISQVPNPTFDTQTKENLTNRITTEIHQNSEVSDATIRKIMKSDIVQSILDEHEMKEKLQLKRMGGGKKTKVNLPKLQDANKAGTRDSDKCHLFLCEGDCMGENTEVMVLRGGEKMNVAAKELVVGDGVITHKSNISVITGVTKKINKGFNIKTSMGELVFGSKHKLFIYDKVNDEFRFEKVESIDKSDHQLVKNRNVFFNNVVNIDNIIDIDSDEYDKVIKIGNEEILSTNTHKFCCMNKDGQYFKMVECQYIDPSKWYLVNYEKI